MTNYPRVTLINGWIILSINLKKANGGPQVYAVKPDDPESLVLLEEKKRTSIAPTVDGEAVLFANDDGLFLLTPSSTGFEKRKLGATPAKWRGHGFRLSPQADRVAFMMSGDLVIGNITTGELETVGKKFSGEFRWIRVEH